MSDLQESTLVISILAMPNARIRHKMMCVKKNEVALLYETLRSS
jgi:hypothetical protein